MKKLIITILLLLSISYVYATNIFIQGSNGDIQNVRNDIKQTFDMPNKYAKEYTFITNNPTNNLVYAPIVNLLYDDVLYDVKSLVTRNYKEKIIYSVPIAPTENN